MQSGTKKAAAMASHTFSSREPRIREAIGTHVEDGGAAGFAARQPLRLCGSAARTSPAAAAPAGGGRRRTRSPPRAINAAARARSLPRPGATSPGLAPRIAGHCFAQCPRFPRALFWPPRCRTTCATSAPGRHVTAASRSTLPHRRHGTRPQSTDDEGDPAWCGSPRFGNKNVLSCR